MDLAYTDDQLALRQAVGEVGASLAGIGDAGLHGLNGSAALPFLTALAVPAEFGGRGLDVLGVAIALESLTSTGPEARPRLCREVALHAAGAFAVARWGSENQRRSTLPDLASGAMIAGLDAAGTGGPHGHLVLGANRLPVDELPGYRADAEEGSRRLHEYLDVAAAAASLGELELVFDVACTASRRFSQRRKLSGLPAEREQSLYHRLADSKAQLDAVQLLIYRAAWSVDHSPTVDAAGAAARLALDEGRQSALHLLDALSDRRVSTQPPLEELSARIVAIDRRWNDAPAPRGRVASTLWK